MLKTYLAVMLGGAAGTGARMWLSAFLTLKYGENFPIGTVLVNVSGCFVIGCFNALTEPHGVMPAAPLVRLVVMVGFLGGFTTFSSFSLQTLSLAHDGEWLRASLNVALSVILCLAAVWAGNAAASLFQQR
jgi:CrcB protein